MSNLSEDIIRETLLGVANTLGVRIDISDETITDLAATLQTEIDRLEAVETESFEFLNELALAFRAAENHPRPQYAPVLEGVRAVLAHLTAAGRLIPADALPTEPDCWDVCEGHPAPAEPAEEETKAEDESGWHWVQSAGGYYSGPACTGGYGCRSMAHYEGCLRPSLTASSLVVPAPTETGRKYLTVAEIPAGVAAVFDEDGDIWRRSGSDWYLADPTVIGDRFAPFVAVAETRPWQDWPSLDAIPADVRTVWDKAGDEYRRENGGWKFRSHGGKWQQITLPLDDYIDYAPFTTAAVAVWDPELGTRNDWTLNEGAEQ